MEYCIWSLHQMRETQRTQGQHGVKSIILNLPMMSVLIWLAGSNKTIYLRPLLTALLAPSHKVLLEMHPYLHGLPDETLLPQ